ncbi:MAG TPA: FkbM family methyltransferase [Acidocella sp.]|nr:FkbM family methyltransferase [Acidocella sp.]
MSGHSISQSPDSPVDLKDCRHGRMLFLRRDMYVGRSLGLYGEFSHLETVLFEQIVAPGMVVVEVGANIGAHTVALAQRVGPGGVVLAFEPQRVIFQLLCANVALNGLFNVRTYPMAAGVSEGVLMVPSLDYAAENNFGGVSLVPGSTGEHVRVTALDSLDLPVAHVLKIDVEGMEADVLAGARGLIARCRPVLYLENDRREKSAALIELLEALGYACWWHTPPLFNPGNFTGRQENVFPGIVSVNLLCLPKERPAVMEGFRKVSGPQDWFNNA